MSNNFDADARLKELGIKVSQAVDVEWLMVDDDILHDDVFEAILNEKDPVQKTKLIQKAEAKAKEKGQSKQFKELLKAHMKRISQGVQERKTEFGLEQEFECGHWNATEEGISTYTMNGEVWATYTPLYVKQILKNIQTDKEKVTLAYKPSFRWEEITLDRSTIATNTKIMQLADYGVSFTSENAKYLCKYINEFEQWNVIPRFSSSSKLGWHKNFTEFLPFTDTQIVIDVEHCFSGILSSLKSPKGDESECVEMFKDILVNGRIEPKYMALASLASVLVEPLGILSFIVHLYGQAGRGKTLCSMFAASMWGKPEEGAFMADPKNTITAFEVNLHLLHNFPFICDDLNKIMSQTQGDFSNFIYLLCSGSGKQRSNINMGLEKQKTWRNVSITNGEKSILRNRAHGGEMLRTIELEMEDGDIFKDGYAYSQRFKESYGHIGRLFVNQVIKMGVNNIKELHNFYVEQIQKNDTEKDKEGKQIQSVALLMTVAKILEKMFDIKDFFPYSHAYNLIKSKSDVNDNKRGYEIICDIVHQNIKAFDEKYDPQIRWGWLDTFKNEALIYPTKFRELCSDANVDVRLFVNWAKKEGLIDRNTNHEGTKTCRTKDGVKRMVKLSLDEEKLQNGNATNL